MKYNRPRIKSVYPIYRLNDETFRIGAQIGITKEFNDPTHQLWVLVNLLDGRPIEDVLKQEKAAFPDLNLSDDYIIDGIDLLSKEELIEEAMPEKEKNFDKRYLSNITYFSRFNDENGDRFKPQRIINNSTILLLGLGGGGANILTLLAGLGPKKIIIIDYDVVEQKNLGRQLLYRESDIGKPKVEVAARVLKEMNSNIEVEAHNQKINTADDITKHLSGVDLVISAIDEPQFIIQRIVNKAIVKANVPCVFGGTQVSRGRVFTIIPGVTGCFDCLSIHYTLIDPEFVQQFIGFMESDFNPDSIAYGPAIFQLTSAVVDEAVRVLTNYADPHSLSNQFEINYEDYSSYSHDAWPRFPDKCPTCGLGSEDDWEVFKYMPITINEH